MKRWWLAVVGAIAVAGTLWTVSRPKPRRLLVSVRADELGATRERALAEQLSAALNAKPGLLAIDAFTLRQRLEAENPDCDEQCFARAANAQAELRVELARGAVPGTWELIGWHQSDVLRAPPSMPVTLGEPDDLSASVRRFAEAFTAEGVVPVAFGPAPMREARPACPPELHIGVVRDLADRTELMLRAHLHRRGADDRTAAMLTELEGVRAPAAPCASLERLLKWQAQAVGWDALPARLEPRALGPPIEVAVDEIGDAVLDPLLWDATLGALAARGFQVAPGAKRLAPTKALIRVGEKPLSHVVVLHPSRDAAGRLGLSGEWSAPGKGTGALAPVAVDAGFGPRALGEAIDRLLTPIDRPVSESGM